MQNTRPPGEIAIGLLWHSFESGNQGVNALTVSNRAIAAGVAEAMGLVPRFTIFAPGRAAGVRILASGDRVVELNRDTALTSTTLLSAIGRLDCMLDISAGDSFAEIYGPKRFAWMWATKRLTMLRGVPLVLAPQTIGPFTRQPYRMLAGGIMDRAALTVARDPLSFDAVARLSPKARRMLSADVAFRLPFTARARAGDARLHVGVNVSGLLWHQSGGAGNAYGLSYDYAAMSLALLEALSARDDVQVHLVTHVVDPGLPNDDDGLVADDLARRFPGAIRVPAFAGPSEAKSYISGLDLMIAARMHACIAAYSSGVPVVPVAYSRKFQGLFGDLLGYGHCLPVTGVDQGEAVRFILDRLDRRGDLLAEVAQGMARVDPLLDAYEQALHALFARVAGRSG